MDRVDGTTSPRSASSSDDELAGERRTDTWVEAALDPREMIDVVGRRFDFLSVIADGPIHKPVLQEELGVSRSTVYKGVRELEECRLVERVDGGYRVTDPSLLRSV